MANYSTLKAAVADVVKTNGTQAITGANLQSVLLSIINSVGGGGYIFKGVATPSTDAGTPDENVFYIGGAGTYANFGTSVVVPPTNIAVFKYNGTWTCEQVTVENGGVFDISAFKAVGGTLATYSDLATALGTNGANIPVGIRKGGMSIKFVQSSDNKYVQYRLMSDTFSTTESDWQGVDAEPTAGSDNLVKSSGVVQYTKEQALELNSAVFGIVKDLSIKFKNAWNTPTQVFVAPVSGEYTITVKSTDFTVISPQSPQTQCLMIDNTVVSLGILTAETISQLTDGYTISNIQLSQGGILELRDRLSGNVSVVVKKEETGLIYEVNNLIYEVNNKDNTPLPGSERFVESGGVFLDDEHLKNAIIANSKGINFDTQICELSNNANFNCQLIHTLEVHKIYTIRLSTDRPLTRLAIVEPIGGRYILDISNVGILKDYEVTYYDARANSVFQMFQTNSEGEKCTLAFSIGKAEQCSIVTNKQNIDIVNREIGKLKDSIQVKESVIFSNTDFLLGNGDTQIVTGHSFKKDSTYLIRIQCNDDIECDELLIYNGNVYDRVTVSGKLNGKEIIYTPFTNGTQLRCFIKGITTGYFLASVKVIELFNYVSDKWSLVQSRAFTGSSTSIMQDIKFLYPNPFINKELRYKVIILFSNAISFSRAYLNLTANPRVTPTTVTQIEIPSQTNTTYVEIEFVAPHDISRIWSTFTFSDVLSSVVSGNAYLLKVGTTENSAIEKDNIENTSNFTGFLISYSSDAETPHPGAKLNLGYSTDGFHFRKLQEPYVHDFYAEYGEELNSDLCIFKKGEYFYLTGSNRKIPDGATNAPVHILKSKNLKEWTLHTTLQFPVSSFLVEEGNRVMAIWAPEILELNGSYYLSFAVGEAEGPYVEKGYLADLNSDLNSYSNLRSYTINMDYFAYTFDNTFLYDAEKGKYYGYFINGCIYETTSLNDSNEGEWEAVGMLPLQENNYHYMEGGTIIKYKGWYYIYGDATYVNGETVTPQNLACFRTKDFKKYEVCFEQFDTKIRHPKIILIDAIDSAIATQLYLDSLI